jgi:hypothetical protein
MKLAVASALLLVSVAYAGEPALVVHEWGTFTSFQDARGATVSGINVDDEPVPAFVHRMGGVPVFTTRSLPARWSQGAPGCHPGVTLRLETPVVYFHPQPGFPAGESIELRAEFAGGWLTEFFPAAIPANEGFPVNMNGTNRGSLHWQRLSLSTEAPRPLPETTSNVWLAPRQVKSAVVTSADSQESEQYVFYRGVGHVDAPIVVRAREDGLEISLRDATAAIPRLPRVWIVRVQPDGRVFYRSIDGSGAVTAAIPDDSGANESQLVALKSEIHGALVAEGLYDDEARAMLETWRLSYFESEGLRLFFLLPRAWVDALLPLTVSPPAAVTRVMMGRIELVSPFQHEVLANLLRLPVTDLDIPPLYAESREAYGRMLEGDVSHSELYRAVGRDPPEALRLYESLGRFRDALLAHEWHAARDPAVRDRLARIMERFSSCDAGLR